MYWKYPRSRDTGRYRRWGFTCRRRGSCSKSRELTVDEHRLRRTLRLIRQGNFAVRIMAVFARGFNHCPMQRHKDQLRKQKDDFQSRLADFPHSFQMSDQEFITENALKSLKNHLEAALKAGYKTDTERAQSLNLLAYTLFRLKDRKEALKRVDEVLEMESQRQNIVSLANKAVMLWDTAGRRGEREQIVMQLENLRDEENFKYLKVKAKAEMASSYMRLGPRYKKYAIDLFDEVIPEGREPEVWSWKLALATAHRHTLDLQHAPFVSEEEENHKHLTEEELQKHFTVLQMLNEIINGTAGQDLKANAYAEIAMVLQSTWDPKAEQRLCDAAHTGIMKACKDALKSDDSEPSVLWKTGKCFRYKKDVHKSLELLQKAVKLQPSSAAYHHLGLTYKAFATEDKRGTLRRRRGRRLGGRRKGKRKNQTTVQGEIESRGGEAFRAQSATCSMNRMGAGRGQVQDGPGPTQRGGPRGRGRGQGRGQRPGTAAGRFEDQLRQPQTLVRGTSSSGRDSSGPVQRRTISLHSGTDSESDVDTEEETVVHGKVGRLPKTVKSPPKGTTTFSWDDKYVRESVENLKESVRFSEKENTRAVYDLALMYKALGEFAEALRCLEDIYDKSEEDLSSSGPLEIVTAYEQAGLIKMEMAEIEKDKDRKRQLHNEADDMLGSALITASRLFEKSVQIQGQFAGVFQSPRALLQAVDNSGRSTQEKQKEKAKLLHLIQKHKKSLAVLRKMAASHREGDAECQMLLIQNLCKIGKFEEAVWSCELLKTTGLAKEVLEELGEEFIQEMYMQAGKQALLQPGTNVSPHFKNAFADTYSQPQKSTDANGQDNGNSNCHVTDIHGRNAGATICDVVILHEEEEDEGEEIQEKAETLASILRHACGLRVTRMDDNDDYVPFGSQGAFEILKTIEKSGLLIVIVGKSHVSGMLQYQITTVMSSVPIAILLVNGTTVPNELRGHRTMVVPPELLEIKSEPGAEYTEAQASSVAELFKFLIRR